MNLVDIFQPVIDLITSEISNTKEEEKQQALEYLADAKDRLQAVIDPDITAEVALQVIKTEAAIVESEGLSLLVIGKLNFQDVINGILIKIIQLIPTNN